MIKFFFIFSNIKSKNYATSRLSELKYLGSMRQRWVVAHLAAEGLGSLLKVQVESMDGRIFCFPPDLSFLLILNDVQVLANA